MIEELGQRKESPKESAVPHEGEPMPEQFPVS